MQLCAKGYAFTDGWALCQLVAVGPEERGWKLSIGPGLGESLRYACKHEIKELHRGKFRL